MSLQARPARRSPTCPRPRPKFEIWVYSPRVEGVHLRFGTVARGGLRWSDRREDFRTEILGLVKAQMVKNTVIVPVGAKGGFVAKQPAGPAVDRDAWLAEGIACYKTFICGLLDITDNLVAGEVVPPPRRGAARRRRHLPGGRRRQGHRDVLRHRQRRRHRLRLLARRRLRLRRLGRLRPQGMGITARGAWESVKRHFRELGVDTQSEDFTVGRRRRHVRRRVRQRHAAVRAHPAGRGLRPPAHLPRPDAGRGDLVRRARAGCSTCRARRWADYDTRADLAPAAASTRARAKSIPLTAQVRAGARASRPRSCG